MPEPVRLETELREAIIKTIAFFDLFDWPLTASEIRDNLDGEPTVTAGPTLAAQPTLAAVMQALDAETAATGAAQRVVAQQDGFYFLTGREQIVITRQQRYNYFVRKLKIARRFARLFGFCPWVRGVYLSNLIGSYNLRDGSDVDFLVVGAPWRLWLCRLYCAGLAKILNRRPRPEHKRDTLCLSFYIASDRSDWDDLKLPGGDPYFDYWRKGLVLLYNKDEKRAAAPTGESRQPNSAAPASPRENLWERAAKNLQLKIMPSALRAAANNSDGVLISDSVLKFYIRDRRREFAAKYEEKIQTLSGAAR